MDESLSTSSGKDEVIGIRKVLASILLALLLVITLLTIIPVMSYYYAKWSEYWKYL